MSSSSSPPPEISHPLQQQVPGSWPEQAEGPQVETKPQSEPPSAFNFRDELKRSRGGSRRHRGSGRYQPRNPNYRLSREELRDLAEGTLGKIDEGQYIPPHAEDPYDLVSKVTFTNDNTTYYAPDDPDIENWNNADLGVSSDPGSERRTQIIIREYSTLVGTRRLHHLVHLRPDFENKVIGVLNFASAKKPGGGFLNGSQAQEESIARSSTLYPSLIAPVAMQFYEHYSNDPNNPFYTHAMLYSPSVVIFRNDKGGWTKPIEVDVLTSAAVNAGEVREQVHQAEEMRLLRERVKAAEEQRRRARERRRQREEDMKRDEEDLKRSLAAKQLSDENTENTDKTSVEETAKADVSGNNVESTQGEHDTKMDVEQEDKDGKAPADASAPQSTPKEEVAAKVASVTAAREGDAETPVEPAEHQAISQTVVSGEQRQESEAPPPPSEPGTSDPAQDPYYLAEVQIDVQMYERIARILYLFHKRGAKHLILGSFGTGVFQNRVELIAGIFYDLLAKPDAKFKNAFDTIVFAILGGPTIKVFREIFGDSVVDKIDGEDDVEEDGSEVEGMKDVESGAELQVAGAGKSSTDHQMDGKSAEDIGGTQTKDDQDLVANPQDVEMSDLAQGSVASSEPELGNAAPQLEHLPSTADANHAQQGGQMQESRILDDAQARPSTDES